MDELLILQEEEKCRRVKNMYKAIALAVSVLESSKKEKSEKIEVDKNYGKKPKPELLA